MPSWGGILKEISDLKQRDPARALDLVRRKYIASQYAHSKRAVILYATKWTQASEGVPPEMVSVTEGDIQGFMEVLHGVKETSLDLIIHSPGGSLAAADACVQYLRSKFHYIRVFVPHAAMSAATMLACAADEIVMGKHSFLGPIDPQLIMNTSLGARSIPAQAILDQFEMARTECQDPARLAVWLPMLQQYGPDLLVQCQNVSALSRELVQSWLTDYMFRGQLNAAERATSIASWLADHAKFKMHGRHINRERLREKGMNILNLEQDKDQQDFILSIFHATTHTFNLSPAVKIIENHLGNAFINQVQQILIQGAAGAPAAPGLPQPRHEEPPFPKKKSR
ncbi:MAG TPA: hypothetical protein VEL80_00895 [Burkholderiales bacterium]|nr:hypothetical protein [Burkholderiales bacterium]